MNENVLKKHFPFFRKNPECIYLDSAATAHKPDTVIEAMTTFYQEQYATVHRAVYAKAAEASQRYNEARDVVQQFIRAQSPSEVVFTRNTTDSINIVARSFGKRFILPGDEIIVSEMEHHSNIVPWQLMADERGARLRVVPVTDQGDLDLVGLQKLLSSKTKIVALAHMSNVLGTINPIKEIAALVHDAGAYVLVDGAQSIAHLPIDVQDLGVDFFAFSGHKIMGPTGIGVLYGREELLEELPPVAGGGDSILQVSFEGTSFQKSPLKFEPGTPPIASAIGLKAAIEFINALTMDRIVAHEEGLKEHAKHLLKEIPGLHILGSPVKRGGLFSFSIDGVHSLDFATLLDANNIACRSGHMCAQPLLKRFNVPNLIRISLGCYTETSDLNRFAEVACRLLGKLGKR